MPNMTCEKCNSIEWHQDITKYKSEFETFQCEKCMTTKFFKKGKF